ncbi:MAG: aspartate aminotransferase, partial [Chloroflexota bacterium]
FQALRRKDAMLDDIRAKIAINFEAISGWMSAQSQLEWVQPQGGVVCFPRIRPDLSVNLDTFYQLLNHKYGTWVGPGHWFEHDRRYMRIGYGWTSRDTLLAGLNTITQAINDACQD